MPNGKYLTPKTKVVKPRVPNADLRNRALCYDFSTLNEIFESFAIKPLKIKAAKVLNKHRSKAFI